MSKQEFMQILARLMDSELRQYITEHDREFRIIPYEAQDCFRIKFPGFDANEFEKRLLTAWKKLFGYDRPFWFDPNILQVELPFGKETPETIKELVRAMGVDI